MKIAFNEEAGGWTSVADDMDVYGVEVVPLNDEDSGEWQLTVWAMEFLRDDPLEDALRQGIASALQSLDGIQEHFEEDREVWVVIGPSSGAQVAQAVADVVEAHGVAITAYLGRT